MSSDATIFRDWKNVVPGTKDISHEDIERHTEAFLSAGGKVETLPDLAFTDSGKYMNGGPKRQKTSV